MREREGKTGGKGYKTGDKGYLKLEQPQHMLLTLSLSSIAASRNLRREVEQYPATVGMCQMSARDE